MKAHKLHENYSEKNPVPTVPLKSLVDPRQGRESKAKRSESNPQEEDQKENEEVVGKLDKGKRLKVKDPVTGDEVVSRFPLVLEEADPRTRGENILKQDFPPPNWKDHRNKVVSTTITSIIYISLSYLSFPIILQSLPIPSIRHHPLIVTLLSLLLPTALAYVLVFRLRNLADEDFDNRLWNAERERGWRGGDDLDGDGKVDGEERIQESAEWVNALLKGVWPIINPDMFSSMMDMIEDIMQSSVPRFVHSVRIADFALGTNPLRITSVRSLPDSDVDDVLEGLDAKDKERLNGEHINLELSFAYRAVPSGTAFSTKAQNAHIKTTLVTLLGLPSISLSVFPMSEHLPNVMNIPVLSTFIAKSINAAAAEYVAPKSLTLDLQQLISGDDIKKDTTAMGVLIVYIHRAVGLKKMDIRESSPADPYVTLTYSKQGKPLYSTRIIEGDLNPVFEEMTVLPLDPNTIKIGEGLEIQLWDSDKSSADDMMGYVVVDIVDLVRNKNKPVRRWSPLASPDDEDRPGSIEYTVGYYGKTVPNSAFKTDGSDPGIPEDLKNNPEFAQARAVALNDLEAAVLVTPPDPELPSGILSVQVHEIRELSVKTFGKEKKGKMEEGEKGQDDDSAEKEDGEGLPSSYCCLEINDELVYSTRVKPVTSSPIFNAGTERFVRDWRKAHVSVVVRDSRMRENDAVLGIVFLKLSELFANASEITRFYSLEHGVGFGRVRVSLLFRPVEAKLPRNLLGFDTGTVAVRNVGVIADKGHVDLLAKCELHLKTYTSSTKLSRKSAQVVDSRIVWHADDAAEIPVQKRYGSALLVAFKGSGVMTGSKKRALAVLWLRDVVDHEDRTVEVALWQSEDYSRLKHNYVPPDGDLSAWDQDKEKMHRIGTVQLDLTFRPGVTPAHEPVLNSKNKEKKQEWDEFDRREAAGLADKIGHKDRTSKTESVGSSNTQVDPEDTQVDEQDAQGTTHTGQATSSDHEEHDDGLDDGGKGRAKGPVAKFKQWKEHEHELGLENRGIKQAKPVRTAIWLKDNIEHAVDKVEDRFRHHAREPDVETEV
ncbi:hypothetical protein JAAARDRAFT_139718 [Jaapia argillacea MUCL 33604]|uniref:C2 domain-containing protein n=1 Tax=Jaapia argillacea MUCL 33604 TaxID=933084 RepID=A0A067PAW5_9AGAM|nr:hypothetical protein JAAARDRAFT_139718 [Jaapia argillacea MUCL 33604]